MSEAVKVTLKLDAFINIRDQIEAGLNGDTQSPVGKALTKWAFRYRAAMQERFDDFSRGGGDWPKLSEQTLKARRNKDKESVSILRDLGILYAVLTPAFLSLPGQLEERVSNGIRVGFGGASKHSEDGTATIADIAYFHHTGAGQLPVRTILIEPEGALLDSMTADMEKALIEVIENA
jgi:hypothetical protein